MWLISSREGKVKLRLGVKLYSRRTKDTTGRATTRDLMGNKEIFITPKGFFGGFLHILIPTPVWLRLLDTVHSSRITATWQRAERNKRFCSQFNDSARTFSGE